MTCNHDHSHNDHQSLDLSRRAFLQAAGAGVAALAWRQEVLPALAQPARTRLRAPLANRAPLATQPYLLLPVGSIKPAGWLRRQLEIQANGLSGHLDEVWPPVGPSSGWLGGSGESHKIGPWFLDGLVPLAWQLDSIPLQAKAQRFIDWTLSSQQPDGMFGPASNDYTDSRLVMLKALTQYHELTGDPRVLTFMTHYFRYQLQALPKRPLRHWGRSRWPDEVVSVIWLYNRTGDRRLLRLAQLLKQQGFDWQDMFRDFPFKGKNSPEKLGLYKMPDDYLKDLAQSAHGVNNAHAIKASPLWSLISGRSDDAEAVHHQLALLDRYHGLPNGIHSADEHLGGRSPSQGVELCAVVEMMYSLELALAVTGEAALADRLERIAYNALPAAFTDDMWAHQYYQQPNQVECSRHAGPWTTRPLVPGLDANLFGLGTYAGCCTANFHQGWPKLTASLWMASAQGGLGAMIYAPCEVATVVREVPVRLSEATDYPFRDQVRITVEPARPVQFPLKLRVPGWARGAKVSVNDRTMPSTAEDGFVVIERSWHKGDRIDIAFDIETRAVPGFNQAVSVEHGALVFSLPLGERWEKLRDHGLAADWEVYPTSAWNYGIEKGARFQRSEQAVPSVPFSSDSPAVVVTVDMRPVPQWTKDKDPNYVPPPPQSPIRLSNGTSQTMTLIPYGAAKLRITSFPTVER